MIAEILDGCHQMEDIRGPGTGPDFDYDTAPAVDTRFAGHVDIISEHTCAVWGHVQAQTVR